jgi:hypothetical protein
MAQLIVKENITRTLNQIEEMTREIYRLEGVLRVFQGLKESGVETIDVPDDEQPTD